jgi:glycerophosphoryl diester phosphodiesterase
MTTQVIAHRGIDLDGTAPFPESSFEAFEYQLKLGFNLEFDLNFTKDVLIVSHDSSPYRLTKGTVPDKFEDLSWDRVSKIYYGGRIPLLAEIFDLILKGDVCCHALHLKGAFQQDRQLHALVDELRARPEVISKLFIFDVTFESALYLKTALPDLQLAPSVAHDHDYRRFNSVVAGTLYTVEDVLKNSSFFSWVWLDEWDLTDRDGATKKFYTRELVMQFQDAGLKVALVSPELHATSPGRVGGEPHPDASSAERLFARIDEILDTGVDAVCTDYPSTVKKIVETKEPNF